MTGWRRERSGRVLFEDSGEHVALALRTLSLDERRWELVLDAWCALVPGDASAAQRLEALAQAFASLVPKQPGPDTPASGRCPLCEGALSPWLCSPGTPSSAWGRCARCGHAALLHGAAPATVYAGPDYYPALADGADARERDYRLAKGRRVLDWAATHLGRAPRSLLEVGSGYGFTLAAAKERGLPVQGVELNAHAAKRAAELFSVATHAGTLAQAQASGAVAPGAWDVVLYQFVLEHLAAPEEELARAATALAPRGAVVLMLPSADAAEAEVFGARYRSLRADHLHLFSRASVDAVLRRAGLRAVACESTCSLHLLRGFLSTAELEALYAAGRGPDWWVLATRSSA